MEVVLIDRANFPDGKDDFALAVAAANRLTKGRKGVQVSIHQDSPGRGYSVIYAHMDVDSFPFAREMKAACDSILPGAGVPDKFHSILDYTRKSTVLDHSNVPSLIIECGGINTDDEKVGVGPFVAAIAKGIRAYGHTEIVIVITSLQGFPEEWDNDAVNAESIAHALVKELTGSFPGEEEDMLPIGFYGRGGDFGADAWVMSVGPVFPGQIVYMYGDMHGNDFSITTHVHPFDGANVDLGEKIGGIENTVNKHGGKKTTDELGVTEKDGATLVIHAPCLITGAVK